MIDTMEFISCLVKRGYTHFCTVPCSFASSLINAAINSNGEIQYIPCANEAVACSYAAGLALGGSKPIVIAQSSGLTNMGSCITSLLKPYSIRFPIIISWRGYKHGDSEIQHAHLATELPNLIQAYGYNPQRLSQNLLDSIEQINLCQTEDTILILNKGTFSEVRLDKKFQINLKKYPRRSEYLVQLDDLYKHSSTIFIGTTGHTCREMYSFMNNTKNFYMAGNMGGVLSMASGIAQSGVNNVIVCGGDAEFVMHMGGMTTCGREATAINLCYINFDNESNKSTGGQATQQGHVDYLSIARGSGFECFENIVTEVADFATALKFFDEKKGALFLHVKCSYDEIASRPPIESVIKNSIKVL